MERKPQEQGPASPTASTTGDEVSHAALVAALSRALEAATEDRRPAPSEAEIGRFTDAVVEGGVGAALELVLARAREGLTRESLLLHLVTGAARQLGSESERDALPPGEVSAALDVLDEVVTVLRSVGDARDPER